MASKIKYFLFLALYTFLITLESYFLNALVIRKTIYYVNNNILIISCLIIFLLISVVIYANKIFDKKQLVSFILIYVMTVLYMTLFTSLNSFILLISVFYATLFNCFIYTNTLKRMFYLLIFIVVGLTIMQIISIMYLILFLLIILAYKYKYNTLNKVTITALLIAKSITFITYLLGGL